jgi:hypothetical protein
MTESGVMDYLEEHANDDDGPFYLYGDSAYTISTHLIKPYTGYLTEEQELFKSKMSRM